MSYRVLQEKASEVVISPADDAPNVTTQGNDTHHASLQTVCSNDDVEQGIGHVTCGFYHHSGGFVRYFCLLGRDDRLNEVLALYGSTDQSPGSVCEV